MGEGAEWCWGHHIGKLRRAYPWRAAVEGAKMGDRGRDSDLGVWFKMPDRAAAPYALFSQQLGPPFPAQKKVSQWHAHEYVA